MNCKQQIYIAYIPCSYQCSSGCWCRHKPLCTSLNHFSSKDEWM